MENATNKTAEQLDMEYVQILLERDFVLVYSKRFEQLRKKAELYDKITSQADQCN